MCRTRFRYCVFALFLAFGLRGTFLLLASESVTPPLNAVTTVGIGEPVIRQGKPIERAAIHLSQKIEFGKGGEYALLPGYYLRSSAGIGWEYFVPEDGPEAGRVLKAPGAITLQGSFHYSNDGKTIGLITNFYQAINAEAKGITRTTRPSLSRDHVQRSLIYRGMSGTKIKLDYQEIWKSIKRPSGEALSIHDLAQSRVVELHGARIEVVEANERTLRYRILRPFQSTETAPEE